MGFRGLLITGIFTLWHKRNLIPRCLCNPEKLQSKETLGKLKSLLKKEKASLHFISLHLYFLKSFLMHRTIQIHGVLLELACIYLKICKDLK